MYFVIRKRLGSGIVMLLAGESFAFKSEFKLDVSMQLVTHSHQLSQSNTGDFRTLASYSECRQVTVGIKAQ